MQPFAKYALGLAALLAIGVGVNARWGAGFKDPSPAARQMREQFEAVETSAGVAVDRHGCETLQKFVATQAFFYQCPVSVEQAAALRPVLASRGWQPVSAGSAVADTFSKGALRARLACVPGAPCLFRLETTPVRPAG